MSANAAVPVSAAPAATMKRFRWPQGVVGRFVARRTMRSATFMALVFGTYVASKSINYASLPPAARTSVTALLGDNVGLKALLGTPYQLQTVSGYMTWNALSLLAMMGAIWALLVATRAFRGEEAAGRWEALLAGQTSLRRATAHALIGLGVALGVAYAVSAVTFIVIGHMHKVGFQASAALYFALASIAGAVVFMSVGALASQLMPARARAARLAVGIFGVCYLLRVAGDITNAHWLLYCTPFGWIEKLQPFYHEQPLWLLPLAGLTLACAAATVFLAGRRDLGAAVFASSDTARPHTTLLGGPFAAAVRLTRTSMISWLLTLGSVAAFFGSVTNTVTQALQDLAPDTGASNVLTRLTQTSLTAAATTYLGIVFFLLMALLMAFAASAVGTIREEESEGYLDNVLVCPVSRQRWIWGRIGLATGALVCTGLLVGSVVWLSMLGQHTGVSWLTLMADGLNTVAPALFVLGIGVAAFGLLPRFTTLIAYSVIAWSFLVQMMSSGITLNHWLLDTSLFHHVAFAPSVDPRWDTNIVLILLGMVGCVIGAAVFNRRDLATE